MPAVIQFFGAVAAISGALVLSYSAFALLNFEGQTALYAAIVGASSLVSGALLYCVGALTDNVRSIRETTARQASILDERLPKR